MRSLCAISAFLLLLTGCGEGFEKKVVGKWRIDMSRSKPDFSNLPPDQRPVVEKTFEDVTLELKADKTFVFKMAMPLSGTWSMSGSTLALKTGNSPDLANTSGDSLHFQVNSDDQTLTTTELDPQAKETIVLARAD
ncbi:MAG: hypothetical protein BGO01_19845 [Armatimonadetes bacterium 55-13]|nr:hypothetical protein [Armatimonadota bacterium]OJU64366.1 MAG: hypothetical protein BGO01_19845 [Armatimonadetes bacterium 55-13]